MTDQHRRRRLAAALVVSLALHLPLAALAMWPGVTPRPLLVSRDPHAADVAAAPDERGAPQNAPGLRSQPRRTVASGDARAAGARLATAALPTAGDAPPLDQSRIGQAVARFVGRSASFSDLVVSHLWQSTFFAIAVAFLSLTFRPNRAAVRYALWFAASVKFLIPFALLAGVAAYLPWAPAARRIADQAMTVTLPQLTQLGLQGLAAESVSVATTSSGLNRAALAVLIVWACGFGLIAFRRLRMWRAVRAAVRASVPMGTWYSELPDGLEVRAAPGPLEPGVVGWMQPILLMPAGIDARVTPPQMRAVIAHELCHVRRHDNLTAVVHMAVETVFWFHPVVWWIGGRLVEERERACDEEVVRTLRDPRAYAEGILNVCRFYVDARLACVAGVSGSNLKKRIALIMRCEEPSALVTWRKALLSTAALVGVTAPITLGTAGAVGAQQQSSRGTVPGPQGETTVYALVVASPDGRMGPRLRRAQTECSGTSDSAVSGPIGMPPSIGVPECGFFGFAPGTDFPSRRGGLAFRGMTMAALARSVGPIVRGEVIDRTGLSGHFDGDFDLVAELPLPPPPPGVPRPTGVKPFASIFAVMPEQLGLALESRRVAARPVGP